MLVRNGTGQDMEGGMADALEISGLEKSFGRNRVLRSIDLSLRRGTVTVLMGANGAGKSTLVNIVCGRYPADAGRMALDGRPYAPRDAADAISNGIATVHQSIDDGVVPDLDVANNLMLDRLARPGGGLLLDERRLRTAAGKVADGIGLRIDLRARVSDIPVADRQMIAIARAMDREPRILILDEPTSSLSVAEANRLFAVIDQLRARGVAILYISHRMSDIRRIADRIVSLRDGRVSGTFEGPELDCDSAVHAMLGRSLTGVDIEPVPGAEPILELRGITIRRGAKPIDLTFRNGEVAAVTGLLGAGKTRLAEIVYGLARPVSGRMKLDGEAYAPRHQRDAMDRGVYLSPKDRAANASVGDFDVANNMTLPFLGAFSVFSFLSGRSQTATARDMIGRLDIVCRSPSDGIGTLSGGNQQKVMIARWLLGNARVLLLDEPFQGVDIGARRDIAQHVRASAQGRATIVFASELDEAIEIADRIIVLNEGSLAGEHVNQNVDLAAVVAQFARAGTGTRHAV